MGEWIYGNKIASVSAGSEKGGAEMIWIGQDGNRYEEGKYPARITADYKVQVQRDGEWLTIAEYDSAEEMAQVKIIYSVKQGFQPRFNFPERGFYKKYYSQR